MNVYKQWPEEFSYWAAEFANRLLAITDGCRPDMHEPDEQDVRAQIFGTILDNAFGEGIDPLAIKEKRQEVVVRLIRDGGWQDFNLASLIAFARIAAKEYLHIE